jgi:hypothetical protein
VEWGNLLNWLSGGTRDSEQAQMRDAWAEVEELWRASPLAENDVSFLVLEMMQEQIRRADRVPAVPILIALCEASETILRQEQVGSVSPVWPVLDNDIAEAVHFRKFLARRRRWAADYDATLASVRARFFEFYDAVFAALPEICFEEWEDRMGGLEVPLIELLDRPAEVIEQLCVFAYSDDTIRRELFVPLREQIVTNIVVASGFQPDVDLASVQHRLKHARDLKGKTATELADLYLRHTPLRAILEFPVPFAVPETSRFEHTHIVGGTGHGKTQLLQRLIHADLVAAQEDGRSVVVIDSQGDLINKLIRLDLFDPDTPGSLADRLVLIDPADVEFPAALNLFDAHLDRLADYRPVDRERVLNGVVELYEVFFGALLGAELTQKQGVIFRYLARLMVSMEGATIHTLMRLMEDGRSFKPHMDKLDGSARYFFETEFFHPSFAATKKQILRRLWGVLSTPAFERMFAQPKNKLDLFEALQGGKIILVSTAKDLLKEEGSALFGRFFIAMLSQAALERSTVSEWERTPTFVYVDEAQEYFGDRIETLLTQARKMKVAIHGAHQALDQLSPRLRAAFNSNTSFKCVGGVSAKDARALADELHTSSDFIESMKRRKDRTEFAAWLKHQTPQAIRLTVPLGHLERQPTLTEEQFDQLIDRNRARYCGTLADIPVLSPVSAPIDDAPASPRSARAAPAPGPSPTLPPSVPDTPHITTPEPVARVAEPVPDDPVPSIVAKPITAALPPTRPPVDREPGKGGKKHRYLQSLVKELGEQQGFRAVVEAPLPDGDGQVDILLTRDGIRAAFEVSVSTPAAWEQENVRKCLAAGYERVALVLAKSPRTQGRFRDTITEGLSPEERERVSFLAPEDLPDYIAGLAPPPEPTETMVKGYRVKVSQTVVSPAEAKVRRERLAGVIARSLDRQS